MNMSDSLNNYGQSLEDAFFMEHDKKLIAQLAEMRKMKETKENLSKISGITNDAILEKLVKLNIRPETLAILSMVPLIEVAWADNNLDKKEKEAIISSATKLLGSGNKIDIAILQEWFDKRPPKEMLTAWTHYIEGLCEKLTVDEKRLLKEEIIGHTRQIAEASGGILGLGSKISKAEAEMLQQLENAFK